MSKKSRRNADRKQARKVNRKETREVNASNRLSTRTDNKASRKLQRADDKEFRQFLREQHKARRKGINNELTRQVFRYRLGEYQAGGNPYAQPTSAATSGYTSTMSGMAGAQQAQMQLAQLQQEIMLSQQQQKQKADEAEAAKVAQFQQDMQTGAADLGQDFGQDAVQKAANAARVAKIAKGTASAQQVAKASKDTGQLLTNLGNYGKGAADGASAVSAAGTSIGAGPIAAAASLAGKGIEHVSDDKDDTKTNFGEGAGRLISGAGSGVGMAAMLGLGPIGLIGAGLVGGTAALLNQRKKKLAAREEEEKVAEQQEQVASSEQRAFEQSMISTGQDQGYNVGNSMTNSYLPGYQMKAGGAKQMIKRADGSYSQRGLWDNIRANKGSGKAPSKQMLKQEKKIKSDEMKGGGLWANIHAKRKRIAAGSGESMRKPGSKGAPTDKNLKNSKQAGGSYMKPLAGGAVEFMGPKHAQGGIMLDAQTEVEGGETMDKVNMKNGGPGDYIFSDFLKVGKKTFAQRHKEMLERGGTQADIQKLAKMQEEVAKREGRDENGERNPEMIMQEGGFSTGEETTNVIPTTEALEDYELDVESAYARDFPEGQSKTEEGLYRRADGDAVTMAEVDALKANNPWYDDWENFDPTDPESVMKFQEAYNAQAPEASEIRVDGKVGEQTVSAYIPYKRQEEAIVTQDTPETDDSTQEIVEEDPVDGLKLRKDIILPYQLLGPMAELNTKYPQPNKVAAATTGRIKLPRVNFNSERAASSANTNAANKFIQNQAAGPGAISAMMATNEKQRAGNLDIANAEARQNKALAAQEEMGNLRASQFDAQNVTAARQFNAASQNQRDQNDYEKRMLAFNQFGTNAAQYANDIRSYKGEERFAEASQISGEYTRQKYLEELRKQSKRKRSDYFGMNDTQLREQAARMTQGAPTYNAQDRERVGAVTDAMNQAAESTQSKRGGYVRKIGKIKRKRK